VGKDAQPRDVLNKKKKDYKLINQCQMVLLNNTQPLTKQQGTKKTGLGVPCLFLLYQCPRGEGCMASRTTWTVNPSSSPSNFLTGVPG